MSIEKLLKTGELAASATAWSISVARSCRQVGSVLAIAPKKPKREKRSAKRLLAQPQNMATVNVSLEPKQNCPKNTQMRIFSSGFKFEKNTDASFCFTVDSRQNTNAFLVFSGKCNERHIRVFSSGYPMIQKNTQKYTEKTHPRHRCSKQFGSNTKGIESTLAWELWLHQQLVALQQHQPCRKEKKQNATAHTKP